MKISSSDRDLIEAYLRKTFRKRERGFFARLCGKAKEYSYEIAAVEEHCATRELTQSVLVWVSVKEPYLDRARLPSAESWGLFALSESECLHLNHRNPDSLITVLHREGGVRGISASSLAALFSDAVLSEKRRWYTVLNEPSLIRQFESWGYALDDQKRHEFTEIYSSPIKTESREITTVSFFSLVGSALSNQSLVRTLLTVGPDGDFRFETTVSFEDFFSHIPHRRIKSGHLVAAA